MSQNLISKEFHISGMITENSEAKIENALQNIEGVKFAKASYENSNLCVTFDEEKIKLNTLIRNVENLGFKVSEKQIKPINTNIIPPKQNNSNFQKTLRIEGMTCTSCEMRIENRLRKMQGIIDVKVSYSNGTAGITFDPKMIGIERIIETIEKLDYKVKGNTNSSQNKDNNKTDKMSINQLIGIAIILFAGYLIIQNTIGFNFLPQVTQNMGYGILFVIGLITSIHCIAMCGGINLSQCVSYKYSENENSKISKLKPSLMYNAGRVISYTIIGGVVGALGSAISFSGAAKGIIAIISGIFMLLMGLNMLNIFPALRKFIPRMPRIFGNKVHNNNGKHGPFYVGLLNGLMPCGPLQAMQIYALGTGSFLAGALSMLVFSLGTVPLMFGFGAISSLLSHKFTKKMMKVSAVLVMILGVIMLNRGFSLSGFSLTSSITAKTTTSGNVAKVNGNVQTVTTTLESNSYTPFTVQKGLPVKWTIKATANNINGCNGTVTIPQYNISKKLQPGDNLIEFTPNAEGNITYTCWMGMISSNIKVVPDVTKISAADIQQSAGTNSQNATAGGGCCGSTPAGFAGGKIPTDTIGIAKISGGQQEVTVTVGSQGYSPAVVVLQKGIPAKIKFNTEQLSSCNSTIVFPELNGQLDLNSQKETPELTPTTDFTFQCGMGMLHGYVKVVDDINKIDLNAVKKEVQNYKPASGGSGGGCCG
jgi:copper ion binding protein